MKADSCCPSVRRYSDNVQVLACEQQYAQKLQGSNVVPVCVPASVQLAGSAIPIYNSTTIYDKLLWAAAWMYRATGDTDYLGDAESFYIRHIYDENAGDVRDTLLFVSHSLRKGLEPSSFALLSFTSALHVCPPP